MTTPGEGRGGLRELQKRLNEEEYWPPPFTWYVSPRMWGDLLASLQEPQPYQSRKVGLLAPPSLTLALLRFNHHPIEFVNLDQILQKMLGTRG